MPLEDFLAGKYRLLHRLGSGSSGLVFKGEQVNTGQAVAIKLLRLNDLDGEVKHRRVQRFRREIAFCSRLYHPEIVRLLDSGELPDGSHFAVLEFIPGTTLAQLLAEEGALKVDRARNLMSQLLPPLAYAHKEGIFHRDLKPSNIMVTPDGSRERLKILDFGISVATSWHAPDLDRLTLSHEWVGTPSYAAPEQLRGEPSGPASDLYAWALIFLECLTGKIAVAGKSLPEIIRQQLLPDPHVLPNVLREHRLGTLLARLLEKNASRRPSDAGGILSILEGVPLSELQDAHGYLRGSLMEVGPTPVVVSDTVTDQPRRAQIEPRRATVLCCQLVPFGGGERVAPERIDPLIDESNIMVREVMTQFGATVSESWGPFTLSYFGLSRARDEDARLALKAAMEIADRVDGTTDGVGPLRAQVGIHNGPVIVQLRDGSRRRFDGLSAAIATRLSLLGDVCMPDESASQILVSEEFRKLIARQAKLLGSPVDLPLRLPWSSEALPVYRIQRGSLAWLTQVREASAFVGRVSELQELQRAWEERGHGGAAVVIQGEPGVGKSRLVFELRRHLEEQGAQWLDVHCLPEWQNGFLRPLAVLCLRMLSLEGLAPAEASAIMERTLPELGLARREAVPLLCSWLSLPMPPGYAPLSWSPQKQRAGLHQVVADLLIGRMEQGTAVLIEDLHWADPSTLECIDGLLRRAVGRQTFVVMTTRPQPRLSFSVTVESLTLKGLVASEARALAAALMPTESTNDADIARIAARSDGIPLYLEELALACRAQAAPSDDTHKGRHLLSPEVVPPSLHDLLTSRLDEVGEAKSMAQLAATIGREFSLDMLAKLLQRDVVSLLGDVEQLVSADILVSSEPLRSAYAFRHALIRDAAYDSMSALAQQRAHHRVAEGLASHFPEMAEAEPDVIAYHWERGGQLTSAVAAWLLAATKSNMASAHLEALAQLDRARALIPQLPPSQERCIREAELLLVRGGTLIAKRGYTDPAAAASFEAAAALVPGAGDAAALAFGARWGLWHLRITQANFAPAEELTAELGEIARVTGDQALAASALEAACQTSFCRSRFEACVQASRRCEAIYDFDRHRHICVVRGDDPHLASLSFEAFAELLQGRWGRALAVVDQGLDLAARLGYPGMKAGMHSQAAWARLVWGGSGAVVSDVTAARAHAQATLAVGEELGFPFWVAYGRALDGAARMMTGDATAIDQLVEGIEMRKAVGAVLGRCFLLTFLGRGLRQAGRYEEGAAALDEALAFCEEYDSRYYEPEVRRERAELLADPGNPRCDRQAALAECGRALALSATINSKWWSLATLLTQARLDDHSRLGELRRLVEEFPRGPSDPPILLEARALLRSERPALSVTA
jgi:TOMM system kinase/cyclase fusion protein